MDEMKPADAATAIEVFDNVETPGPATAVKVRPLSVDEGLRRIQQRRELQAKASLSPLYMTVESPEDRHAREVREADVVAAARRSQAEIRRHIDAYLKEHFETIAADIAAVVVQQVHERLIAGAAAQAEAQAITLDRIAADMRREMRAFARAAWQGKEPE